MRYIPTSRLRPGMALGQDIYDGAGRLLLAKHLLLTSEYISNLEFLGYPGIYIDDEFTCGIEISAGAHAASALSCIEADT